MEVIAMENNNLKEQKLIEQREKENLNINHKNIKKEKFRIK